MKFQLSFLILLLPIIFLGCLQSSDSDPANSDPTSLIGVWEFKGRISENGEQRIGIFEWKENGTFIHTEKYLLWDENRSTSQLLDSIRQTGPKYTYTTENGYLTLHAEYEVPTDEGSYTSVYEQTMKFSVSGKTLITYSGDIFTGTSNQIEGEWITNWLETDEQIITQVSTTWKINSDSITVEHQPWDSFEEGTFYYTLKDNIISILLYPEDNEYYDYSYELKNGKLYTYAPSNKIIFNKIN